MTDMVVKTSRCSADTGNSLADTDAIIKSMDGETDRECSTLGRGNRGGGSPPGRPRRRWDGSYKVRPVEIGCEVDWTDLVRNRDQWRAVVGTVMNLWLP